MLVPWVYTYTDIYQVACLKFVYINVCKSYFNSNFKIN